jgi:hypothetical protein
MSVHSFYNDKHEIYVNEFIDFEFNSLFNSLDFFYLHANRKTDFYFQLIRKADKKVIAALPIYQISKNIFSSPKKGTFSTIDNSSDLSYQMLSEFLKFIDSFLHYENGAMVSSIKLPPDSHDQTKHTFLLHTLLNLNYKVNLLDINFDLKVDKDCFESKISYSAKKTLKKNLTHGHESMKLPFSEFDNVYSIIEKNRSEYNYPMSMTRDALKEMLKIFPEKFFLFGVYTPAPNRALIASSICIEVQKNILYIFYWGEDPAYRKLSPVTLLSKIIYGYAQDYKFDLLDAGIASSEGKINLGLIKFKQNLGFRASSKIILTKSFPQLNDGN